MNEPRHWTSPTVAFATRILLLTFPMLLAIATLAVVEVAILWRIGVTYNPKSRLGDIGVLHFSLASEGRWGISRVYCRRVELVQSCTWEVLLHDMQRPKNAKILDVGQLQPMLVSVSRRGNRFAVAGMNSVILSWDELDTSALPRAIIDARSETLHELAHSPDGEWLFAASNDVIYVWQTRNGKLAHKLKHACGKCSFSFSDDSTKFLFMGWDNRLRLFDIEKGQLLADRTLAGPPTFAAALSPDGKRAATVAIGGRVTVYDIERDRQLWESKVRTTGPIAFSRDGEKLAVVNETSHRQYELQIRHAGSGRTLHQCLAHQRSIPGLVFASDDSLISWDLDGHIRRWSPDLQTRTWDFSAREWASDHQWSGSDTSQMSWMARAGIRKPGRAFPALLTHRWLSQFPTRPLSL